MFKSLGGLGNMASLLGSAQKVPGMMKEMQEKLKREIVQASAGDGAVQVTINGVGEMQSIAIDPAVRDFPELEQWIVEACNTAGRDAKQRYVQAVSAAVSDLNINIPGLDGILANLVGGA